MLFVTLYLNNLRKYCNGGDSAARRPTRNDGSARPLRLASVDGKPIAGAHPGRRAPARSAPALRLVTVDGARLA